MSVNFRTLAAMPSPSRRLRLLPLLPCFASVVVVAACVPDKEGSRPAPLTAEPRASAGIAAAASVTPPPANDAPPDASAPVIAEGPAKWRTVAREDNGFWVALDGVCSQLGVGRAGKDVVVHYGGISMYESVRSGMASFVGLRNDGLEPIGDPRIAAPTGVAGKSLEDFWIADSTGSRSSEGAVLHRRIAGAWKTYPKDQTNIHAWLDGGIIGTGGMAISMGEVWVEGSSTKPPLMNSGGKDGAMFSSAFAAFPTGEVFVFMSLGEHQERLVARHWSPKSKLVEHDLSFLGTERTGTPVLEVSPDELYVAQGRKIGRWDGSKWRLLGTAKSAKSIERMVRGGPDDVWLLLEGGSVERATAAGVTPVAIPEPVASIDLVAGGAAWAVGVSGKVYRREGEQWKNVPLPRPVFSAAAAFKAKHVLAVAPDDFVIIGMYWEKGPGWTEQELHTALLRTKPVKETLRCNEPDPENNNAQVGRGFQSWPPMATAECKTPFVVLARRSNAKKNHDDWPRIRAGLKGHPELGEVALVDFVSGDRTFVGTRASSYDAAKKIVALVAPRDRLRPEIVCGEPEAVRTLAIDLASGQVAAK